MATLSDLATRIAEDIKALRTGKVDGDDPRLTDARTPTTHTHQIREVDGLEDALVDPATGWLAICRWAAGGEVTLGTMPAGIEPDGNAAGGIFIARTRERVTIAFVEARVVAGNPTVPLPYGFRGNNVMPFPAVMLSYRLPDGTYAVSQIEVGATQIRLRVASGARLSATGTGGYGVQSSWDSTNPFPTKPYPFPSA